MDPGLKSFKYPSLSLSLPPLRATILKLVSVKAIHNIIMHIYRFFARLRRARRFSRSVDAHVIRSRGIRIVLAVYVSTPRYACHCRFFFFFCLLTRWLKTGALPYAHGWRHRAPSPSSSPAAYSDRGRPCCAGIAVPNITVTVRRRTRTRWPRWTRPGPRVAAA